MVILQADAASKNTFNRFPITISDKLSHLTKEAEEEALLRFQPYKCIPRLFCFYRKIWNI